MKYDVIIVSGFAGSGKSTLVRNLGIKYKKECIYASGILKELREKSIDDIGKVENTIDWWESEEGMKYVQQRGEDMSFDQKLDEALFRVIEKGNIVVDSKTMGNLSKKGFKTWLDASLETRAKRVYGRDNLSIKEVMGKLDERDKVDTGIYKKLYGFNLGKDFDNFNLILGTDNLNEEEVVIRVIGELEK